MDSYTLMQENRIKFGTTIKPMAKWRVFRQCNFKCQYCSVTKYQKIGPLDLDPYKMAELVLNFIPRNWRIYLTGGELTTDIKFLLSIIKTIGNKGNEIRLISNLSASIEDYLKLEEESNKCLLSFFFTYHPSMVSEQSFINKAKELRNLLPLQCKIYIRQVILPNKESMESLLHIKSTLEQPNLEVVPLRLLFSKGKHHFQVDYSNEPLYSKVFGDYPHFPNRKGTYCPAGYQYVYINSDLSVYTCIPCKGDPDSYSGNLYHGDAKLNDVPKLCNKDFCSCVPGK